MFEIEKVSLKKLPEAVTSMLFASNPPSSDRRRAEEKRSRTTLLVRVIPSADPSAAGPWSFQSAAISHKHFYSSPAAHLQIAPVIS